MSDSHVNDIRYTALWRPVVKAREAPAASPPSPSPSLLHLGRFSLSVARGFAVRSCAFPFSFPLGKSRVSVVLARCEFRRRDPDADVGTTANSICSDGKRGESVCSLYEGRGRRNRPWQLRPLRAQQLCVSPSGTRCPLCGDNRLSLTHRRSKRLPFVHLANQLLKSILPVIYLFNLWILLMNFFISFSLFLMQIFLLKKKL